MVAFVLFIVPAARRNCVHAEHRMSGDLCGRLHREGHGPDHPGLTPDTLGEIYEYYPTLSELRVAAGIFAVGFLIFTLMLKVAVPISLGEFMGPGEKVEADQVRQAIRLPAA